MTGEWAHLGHDGLYAAQNGDGAVTLLGPTGYVVLDPPALATFIEYVTDHGGRRHRSESDAPAKVECK